MKDAHSLLFLRLTKIVYLTLIAMVVLVGCTSESSPTGCGRPDTWAKPVSASPGLPNLHRVNAKLYRSAQPTEEGFEFLSRQSRLWNDDPPIKTVLSLCPIDRDTAFLPTTSPLRLEQISFKTWHPEDEDVVKFLRIVTTPSLQPVLVHCQHGSDRTGTMIAVYRVIIDGWSKDDAVREMTNGGFGFHPMWKNLISYIKALDVDVIKAEVAKQGRWQ